jgi:predicted phage tail protein
VTLTNGGVGSWQPSTLADGAYFGLVRAVDAAGNASAWSAPRGFSLDTGPPAVPVSVSPAPGTRTAHTPSLKATYADTAGAPGTLTFQLCTTSSCGTVLQTGVASGTASDASGSWTPDGLSDGNYYWRARAEDSAGNQSAWSAVTTFVVDSTPPPEPTLLSAAGLRAKAAPILRARSVRAAADEPVRLAFQVCSDAACALVRGVGYATAEGGDATAQWQPPALADGTYYWRAFAVDGAANESGWSATRPFVIDNTAPDVPTPAADAPERAKRAQLAATFASADPTDSGTLFFQLCTDVDCASVIATGSDEGLGAGSMGRWTASLLRDGDYYWRARAVDVAGNSSDWSATQHVALDTTPPGKLRGFTGTLTATTLSLRWKAPAAGDSIEAYVLYVNGNRSRSVDASSLGLDIHLRAGDTRSFAVAAVDSTGNIGTPTRAVVLVPRLARLTLEQAKAATADQGLLLRWSKRSSKATPTRVIGQSPAPQTIVETGSLVTVVVDGPARAARR